MCQLLAMSSRAPASLGFSFTGFTERGGRTADHVDGWGIGFYEPSGCRVFHDDQPAADSALARFVRDHRIKSRIVMAHLRKATQGEPGLSNCHPFQREWLGQAWLFAMNGDLRDFEPELTGPYRPIGRTDSERAFCWMLQQLRAGFDPRAQAPAWQELAPVLAALAYEIARHGNFNFVLSNGDALFVHCSSRLHLLQRQHPFPTARLADCELSVDLGALNTEGDRMCLVATEPLTLHEHWTALRSGEMKVFVDGAEVWQHVDERTRAFAAPCLSGRSGAVRSASGRPA